MVYMHLNRLFRPSVCYVFHVLNKTLLIARLVLSFGKEHPLEAFVGWLVGGEKCGKLWKLTEAMSIQIKLRRLNRSSLCTCICFHAWNRIKHCKSIFLLIFNAILLYSNKTCFLWFYSFVQNADNILFFNQNFFSECCFLYLTFNR